MKVFTIRIIKIILSLVLFLHFAAIALYLSPENPIKQQYKYKINSYVNPFFSQVWNLFAPDPISSNNKILYQFKIYNKNKIFKTEWLDVSTPMNQLRRENIMSPSLRVLRLFASINSDIGEKLHITKNLATNDTTINLKDSATFNNLRNSIVEKCDGHKSALQYSIYVANKYLKMKNITYDSVCTNYMIVFEIFPRFSKRQLDYYDKKNYTFRSYTSKNYRIL